LNNPDEDTDKETVRGVYEVGEGRHYIAREGFQELQVRIGPGWGLRISNLIEESGGMNSYVLRAHEGDIG
jgi:hypothetical protein